MNHDPPYVVLVGLTNLFHYFYYYFCYADVLKPTEKQLMIELHNTVADKWHAIGTFLEISGGQLNIIADRHRGDPQKCLMDMLSGWLQRINPPATWSDIAGAVEFTGRPDVAQQIRQKYCQASYQPQLLPQPPQQQTMLPYLQSSQIAMHLFSTWLLVWPTRHSSAATASPAAATSTSDRAYSFFQ